MGFRYRSVERGDTIIEVLIAIAVVSSVLAITYSIMNRNLLTIRDNQERTEASKLAQSQLERLKNAWNTADLTTFPGSGSALPFCMGPDIVQSFKGDAPTTEARDDDFSNYPNECVNGLYHLGIRHNSGQNSYLVTVRWDSVTGVRSEVVMGYKLQ